MIIRERANWETILAIQCENTVSRVTVNRLSKVYYRRNTYTNKRVEYFKGETPLKEVQGFLCMVTVYKNMI